MKAEIKEKWAQALESGKYKQGLSWLNYGDCLFCVHGVLCELAVEEGIVKKNKPRANDKLVAYVAGTDSTCMDTSLMPFEVAEWAGFVQCIPFIKYQGRTTTLYALNDEFQLSFSELAKIIRESF